MATFCGRAVSTTRTSCSHAGAVTPPSLLGRADVGVRDPGNGSATVTFDGARERVAGLPVLHYTVTRLYGPDGHDARTLGNPSPCERTDERQAVTFMLNGGMVGTGARLGGVERDDADRPRRRRSSKAEARRPEDEVLPAALLKGAMRRRHARWTARRCSCRCSESSSGNNRARSSSCSGNEDVRRAQEGTFSIVPSKKSSVSQRRKQCATIVAFVPAQLASTTIMSRSPSRASLASQERRPGTIGQVRSGGGVRLRSRRRLSDSMAHLRNEVGPSSCAGCPRRGSLRRSTMNLSRSPRSGTRCGSRSGEVGDM